MRKRKRKKRKRMAENGAVLPKNDLEVGWITATDDRAAGNRGSSTSTFATTDEAKNGDKTTVSKDPHTTQPNFQSGDVDIDVAAAAGGPEYHNHFTITGSSGGTVPRDFYGYAIAMGTEPAGTSRSLDGRVGSHCGRHTGLVL